MYTLEDALAIYKNKALFEEIHQAKMSALRLLENVSNRIDLNELAEMHAGHKGVKISKGNELEHCPYQVLDVVRDFDPTRGLNIRLLHWWGYGMFLFVLLGKDYLGKEALEKLLFSEPLRGFVVSKVPTPFDYKRILEEAEQAGFKNPVGEDLSSLAEGRIQLVKKIPYEDDFMLLENRLVTEITQLFPQFRTG